MGYRRIRRSAFCGLGTASRPCSRLRIGRGQAASMQTPSQQARDPFGGIVHTSNLSAEGAMPSINGQAWRRLHECA